MRRTVSSRSARSSLGGVGGFTVAPCRRSPRCLTSARCSRLVEMQQVPVLAPLPRADVHEIGPGARCPELMGVVVVVVVVVVARRGGTPPAARAVRPVAGD